MQSISFSCGCPESEQADLRCLGREKCTLEVLIKVRVGDLVTVLEFPVVISLFLDGIIGEMDVLVVKVLEVKLFACGSQVSILVPVGLCNPICSCHKHEAADIELSLVEQERLLEVLLDYQTAGSRAALVSKGSDLPKAAQNCDSITSVRILPWFAYPSIVTFSLAFRMPREFFKMGAKSSKFRVRGSLSNMESQGNHIEYFLVDSKSKRMYFW